jgi:hypothetical protein
MVLWWDCERKIGKSEKWKTGNRKVDVGRERGTEMSPVAKGVDREGNSFRLLS